MFIKIEVFLELQVADKMKWKIAGTAICLQFWYPVLAFRTFILESISQAELNWIEWMTSSTTIVIGHNQTPMRYFLFILFY